MASTEGVAVAGIRSEEEQRDHEDLLTLVPVMGMCCAISSFFLKWPDCIGVSCVGDLLCFRMDAKLCKRSEKEKECCIIQEIFCIARNCDGKLCKLKQQAFCFDSRCSLPCDDTVPCILTLYGINCMYKWQGACGCCQSIGQMAEKIGEQQTNVKN